jgi:hypothetical protein
MSDPTLIEKLKLTLPWLSHYPFWRMSEMMSRPSSGATSPHVVVVVADHFEPSWNEQLLPVSWDVQMRRVDKWIELARATGETVRDVDGKPFVHTCFYPAEQYHGPLLDRIAEMEAEGLGEVEIHLHHGVEKPDTAENTRRELLDFRDALAEDHRCLSRMDGKGDPMYAFVHGNWALANSMSNRCCGVDNEMEILAETGCYADLTLPAIPFESQSAILNSIYECKGPFDQKASHFKGSRLRVGDRPKLPFLLTGPLVFNWRRRKHGVVVPRIEDGALAGNFPLEPGRFDDWLKARISVIGRPDWIFIKLYCHAFFDHDQPVMIGEDCKRFWLDLLNRSERTGEFKIHFATSREAFNMIMAALDGREGDPHQFRDYRLQQIRKERAYNGRPEPTLPIRVGTQTA